MSYCKTLNSRLILFLLTALLSIVHVLSGLKGCLLVTLQFKITLICMIAFRSETD